MAVPLTPGNAGARRRWFRQGRRRLRHSRCARLPPPRARPGATTRRDRRRRSGRPRPPDRGGRGRHVHSVPPAPAGVGRAARRPSPGSDRRARRRRARLAGFASAVAAVSCALSSRGAFGERNAAGTEPVALELRIGAALGETVHREGDVSGQDVNAAACLEALAAPGAVRVSGEVRDEAAPRLDAPVEAAGERCFKASRCPSRPIGSCPAAGRAAATTPRAPALPSQASVALPPLPNRSGDAGQAWLDDGTVEGTITALLRFPSWS